MCEIVHTVCDKLYKNTPHPQFKDKNRLNQINLRIFVSPALIFSKFSTTINLTNQIAYNTTGKSISKVFARRVQ